MYQAKFGTGLVASQPNAVYVHLRDLVMVKGHEKKNTDKKRSAKQQKTRKKSNKENQPRKHMEGEKVKIHKEATLEEEHKLEENLKAMNKKHVPKKDFFKKGARKSLFVTIYSSLTPCCSSRFSCKAQQS